MTRCSFGIHSTSIVHLLKAALPVNRQERDHKHLNHFTRRLIEQMKKKRRLHLIKYKPHLQAILFNSLLCVHSA